jgi:hypothetical protein
MTTTPSPKSNLRSSSSWTPWSEEHMKERFCVSCSKESLVVKCGGCSEVGQETWYCPECLESSEECSLCEERERNTDSSSSSSSSSSSMFMSPLSPFNALSNRTPSAALGFEMFKSAIDASDSISDTMTT